MHDNGYPKVEYKSLLTDAIVKSATSESISSASFDESQSRFQAPVLVGKHLLWEAHKTK